MCDSFWSSASAQPGAEAVFGKNSDRHPEEPQFLVYEAPVFRGVEAWERLAKYESQRKALERAAGDASFRFGALLSRPSWIWGAEMGVNERGVAIGNEAVFSRGPHMKDGLLGMDILRLALHGAGTAAEGAVLVAELIRRWGQGGDGGYRSTLRYSNSFLVADGDASFVVETSGRRAEIRRVAEREAISNCYIRRDMGEEPLHRFIARGRARRALSLAALDGTAPGVGATAAGPSRAFSTLRLHRGCVSTPVRGMGSICMHSARAIASGTTASLVVSWRDIGEPNREAPRRMAVAWATESPHPCVSLYSPVWAIGAEAAPEALRDRAAAAERYRRRKEAAVCAAGDFRRFSERRRRDRDRIEADSVAGVASARTEPDLAAAVASARISSADWWNDGGAAL